MVSGLAPGRAAETRMVGKSTCGSGETGRRRKATAPASASANVSSVVATGRRMKGAEMFMALSRRLGGALPAAERPAPAGGEAVEREVDDGRGVERERLADDQPADDRDPERTPQLRPDPVPSASGSAPSSAAIVVIMIGRKRSRDAW